MSAPNFLSDEILKPAEPALLLCPLDFERRAMLRYAKIPVKTVGPGPEAIHRAFAERSKWPVSNPRLVILAGVAGALRPAIRAGDAFAPTTVVGCDARPTLPRDHTSPPVSIAQTNTPVHDPSAKARLYQTCGADLVDTESLAFAQCACAAKLPWAIVRGVGDAAQDTLPREVTSFVDASGATRLPRVIGAILRRPTLLRELITLGRNSQNSLQNAAFLADAFGALPPISLCTRERPLLLYGGSFDPPHARHTTMLLDAMRALGAPVAMVMPAALNPLKLAHPPANRDARLALCRAAFSKLGSSEIGGASANPPGEIRLSQFELRRDGPSFTIDTVRALLDSFPHLAGAISFLVGSDAMRGIERWHRWRELLELARLAIAVRPPDDHVTTHAFLVEFAAKHGFADAPSWMLPLPPIDLSSTEVRQAIARGERPREITDEVWREITAHRLYGFGSVR